MWSSKHIFIHDYRLIDHFLKYDLLPFLDKQENLQYFFIRYWNGGPHVRLRYKQCEDLNEEILLENIKILLEQFKDQHNTHEYENIKYNKNILDLENVDPVPLYENYSIQDIKYEPEYERYGGRNVMDISEDLFVASSKFASKIIQDFEFNQRYSIVIDLMYECSKILKECDYCINIIDIFNAYRSIWNKFKSNINVENLKKIINRRMTLLDSDSFTYSYYREYLNEFRKILLYIKEEQRVYEYDRIMYLGMSHIHMLNNRLGISPENEHRFSNIFVELLENKKREDEDSVCGHLA